MANQIHSGIGTSALTTQTKYISDAPYLWIPRRNEVWAELGSNQMIQMIQMSWSESNGGNEAVGLWPFLFRYAMKWHSPSLSLDA